MQRSIRFPDDVAAAIEAAAKEQDRSFSYLVVRACADRFLFEANPFSVSERPKRRAEEQRFEKSVADLEVEATRNIAEAAMPPSRPVVPRVPGVVRASSLVKRDVRPVPKRGEK